MNEPSDANTNTESETPRRSSRRRSRDALVPSKNAYVHFSNRKRKELQEQHPSWTVQEVSAEIGRQWREMSERERVPWVELAQFDKVRYQREFSLLAHESSAPSGHHHHKPPETASAFATQPIQPSAMALAKPKQRKPKGAPRQPDTAYTFFWKAVRPRVIAELPELSAPMVSREVGRRWRALTPDERQCWDDMATKDRTRYDREMAAYNQQHPMPSTSGSLPTLLRPIKDPFAPKAPRSGFQFFLQHNQESFTLLDMTINEFRQEMSALWKRMSDQDKVVWLDMAKQDEQRYAAEMEAYEPPAYLQMQVQPPVASQRVDELRRLARKLPDAPAPPQTAYNLFAATQRQQMQVSCSEKRAQTATRAIGKAWKALSDVERLPFVTRAQRDVERFVREMEELLVTRDGALLSTSADADADARGPAAPPAPAAKRPRTRSSSVADSGDVVLPETKTMVSRRVRRSTTKLVPPKRPLTAFNMMYLTRREELMQAYQLSHNDCSALCGKLWREMADAAREPFYRMAAQDKLRFERERREYDALAAARGLPLSTGKTQPRRRPKKRATALVDHEERVSVSSPSSLLLPSSLSSLWDDDEAEEDIDHTDEDPIRQLEERARAILGELPTATATTTARPPLSQGFRYYVESKRPQRERWTNAMWIEDWTSLTAPHRALWEELAGDA
ncbi:hypothetical protein PINS_up008006 [Pythium insidiosum]|nr:hypothetical protein PINS_up008006 [Pythium insidiosum]